MVYASQKREDRGSLTEPLVTKATNPDRRNSIRVVRFADEPYDAEALSKPWQAVPPSLSPSGDAHRTGEHTFFATTMSLSKVILGTGILVIPKAFQLLGVAPALVVLALVGLMTWFSIVGLLDAADETGKDTYASCVRAVCGKPAKWGITFAVFCNCLGMCVIIFSDILIGSASDPGGLISDFMPGLPADSLLLDRRVILAALLLLLLPLGLQRNMAALNVLNGVGVAAVATFAISTTVVAAAAIHTGQASPVQWLPDWSHLGDGTLGIVLGCLAVAPVLLSANCCHQSIFPTMTMLKPYSAGGFSRVTALALVLCNVLYALIAVTSIIAFGDRLQDDALGNLSAAGLEPLIGRTGAEGMSLLVRLSYFISLTGSFILQLYPLRQCVLEVVLGDGFKIHSGEAPSQGSSKTTTLLGHIDLLPGEEAVQEQRQVVSEEGALFVPVTLILLVVSYAMAVLIPSVWVAISLVGSVCSTLMGFIFPGLMILMMERATSGWCGVARQGGACAIVLLGGVLFVNGFVSLAD